MSSFSVGVIYHIIIIEHNKLKYILIISSAI